MGVVGLWDARPGGSGDGDLNVALHGLTNLQLFQSGWF